MDRRFWAGFLKIFVPLLLLVGGGGVLVVYMQHQQVVVERSAAEAATVSRAANAVEARFGRTLRDIVFLSRHAAMRSALNAPVADSLSHIAHNFLAFSISQGVYDQIRWIDETGHERVRVDHNDGKPIQIADKDLQDKSKRYYFTETMTLAAAQIFVSPLDLNVENEVIERPFKPMIRIGIPLFDDIGARRGMILLNYFGKDVISGFQDATRGSGSEAMLLNEQGHWLHSPRSGEAWGFMFKRTETFATRNPEQWAKMADAESGQIDGGNELWSWATVHPFHEAVATGEAVASVAKPYNWKIVTRLPASTLLKTEKVAIRSIALYCLMLLIPGALGSVMVARSRIAQEDILALAEKERMRESESRFELLLASSTNGLLIVADNGTVARANSQAEAMFGYTAAGMMGMNVDDLVPPSIHATHAQYRHQYMAAPTARRLGLGRELSAKRFDGSEFPVEISLAPLQMRGKTYVLTTVIDITERKLAEQRVNEQQKLLDRMSRLAKVGGWEFDATTGKGTWTDEVARIHDLDPSLPTSMEVGMQYFSADMRQRIEAAIAAAIAQGIAYDLELELTSAKGVRKWVRTQGIPHVINGVVVSVRGAVQDITDRKLAELEVQALNADLEQRVRLRTEELMGANRELEAFAYAVSHDLRAPLRAMMGFSQALFEDCSEQLDEVARDYLNEVIRASRSMGTLIEGLLTLSRSTQGIVQRDVIDLTLLARLISADLSRMDPGRDALWQIEDGMVTRGDERMIQTVLHNLLSNAWKYTAKTPKTIIRMYSSVVDGVTRFFITDNGAGFDMAHTDRLFKPFQRLHRQDEFAGLGIGLATVQRVIQRHGGTIDVSAELGRGATFSFSLGTDDIAAVTDRTQESR